MNGGIGGTDALLSCVLQVAIMMFVCLSGVPWQGGAMCHNACIDVLHCVVARACTAVCIAFGGCVAKCGHTGVVVAV